VEPGLVKLNFEFGSVWWNIEEFGDGDRMVPQQAKLTQYCHFPKKP